MVVAWRSECKGIREDFWYLESNREEANTKIILHAIDATASGATELRILSLGPEKAAALQAFHALSGADNTGCFSGKGKAACWKVFMEADEEIINSLF